MNDQDSERPSDSSTFPIFSGGPFYRLQERLGLVPAGERRLGRCVVFMVLVAWVPMAILSALQGLVLGPKRMESFLMDFEVNVRFLLTVPAFLFAEGFCERLLREVIQQFPLRGLVRNATRARFDALVREVIRLSHSGRVEAGLLGLAYLQCVVPIVFFLELPEATWRLSVREGHLAISLAGWWYFLVAFPMYAFLLWRWLWRLGLWWRLLWQTSGLELRLIPAHRDGAGGLGFLSVSLGAFAGFAFAVTAMAVGGFADLVVYEGRSPLEYQWEFGGVVALLLILIVGPVLLFVRQLYEAKENAKYRYGQLASHQIQHVEEKWLSREAWPDDAAADFRAVSHLGNSVAVVHAMSIFPLYKDDLLVLLLVTLLPFLPLLGTLVPMEEVLGVLLKVLA